MDTHQVNAYQKLIRQSPRKMRLVADLVRGRKVDQALTQLKFSSKIAAETILKVVRQAQANAINNQKLEPKSLLIKDIQIHEGPTYKRFRAVSRGRGHKILKRSSHIKVVVEGSKQA